MKVAGSIAWCASTRRSTHSVDQASIRQRSVLSLLILTTLLFSPLENVARIEQPVFFEFGGGSMATDRLREEALHGYAVQDLPVLLRKTITTRWNDCLSLRSRERDWGGKPSGDDQSALEQSAFYCASTAVRSAMNTIIPGLSDLGVPVSGAAGEPVLSLSRMPKLPPAPPSEHKVEPGTDPAVSSNDLTDAASQAAVSQTPLRRGDADEALKPAPTATTEDAAMLNPPTLKDPS